MLIQCTRYYLTLMIITPPYSLPQRSQRSALMRLEANSSALRNAYGWVMGMVTADDPFSFLTKEGKHRESARLWQKMCMKEQVTGLIQRERSAVLANDVPASSRNRHGQLIREPS